MLFILVAVEYGDKNLVKRHEKCIVLNQEQEPQQINQRRLVVLGFPQGVKVIHNQREYHHQVGKGYIIILNGIVESLPK